MKFSPRFMATHLAAVPHRDPDQVCDLILKNFPEAPCIPRLTKSTRMYLERIPCLVVDSEKRKLWFDLSPAREKELLEFYDRYESGDLDYFGISPESAPGMYALLEKLRVRRPKELRLVHVQTPGPVTWGLTITDGAGTPALYNETLRDVLVKTLAMKARWQERKIKELLPGVETLVDFGEPSLVLHTSAVGSGLREDVIGALNGVLDAVEGVTCIHCCANIDWTILMDTHTDVINFDAYEHSDKLALYPKELNAFLARGGAIAWGIVPTSDEKIASEDLGSLSARLEHGLGLLTEQGVERAALCEQAILTPSCATSNMTLAPAEKAFELTNALSRRMRERC